MQSLQNYIMRNINTQNKKKPGYLLLQAILAMTAFTMMSYGLVLAFSSSFNMYGASKVALEAQQYAEIEANTLKMLGYDKLATAGHNRAALSYAGDWESQITIGNEQVIDADNDNRMRIVSVDIFKNGDTTSRYTLNVPLTSQGASKDKVVSDVAVAGTQLKISYSDKTSKNMDMPPATSLYLRTVGANVGHLPQYSLLRSLQINNYGDSRQALLNFDFGSSYVSNFYPVYIPY